MLTGRKTPTQTQERILLGLQYTIRHNSLVVHREYIQNELFYYFNIILILFRISDTFHSNFIIIIII